MVIDSGKGQKQHGGHAWSLSSKTETFGLSRVTLRRNKIFLKSKTGSVMRSHHVWQFLNLETLTAFI